MGKLERIENGRKSISTRVPVQYQLIIYEALVRVREAFAYSYSHFYSPHKRYKHQKFLLYGTFYYRSVRKQIKTETIVPHECV